ncbi:uncharacterized protein LOC129879835 [Solanum dulcamara]|uniref:uncharacterized protein LOC129879835 n=1 Tax=Solanum dulcamara TaxID=45834 RepID=UPI002484EF92|nr:uncharacterized protein LOC129879835 [Solanum dulcamara]
MSSFSRSGTLLCVFLLLGTCIGIVIAREPKTENNKESFGTSSIRLWPRWRWHHHHAPSLRWWLRTHPKKPSPPTHMDMAPSPSPVDNVASVTHASPSPSPVDNAASPTHAASSSVDDEVSPQHTALAPMTSCINVDGCKSNLITSVFKRKISLSTQCCKVLSTISDGCFYREFSHSKRVPFFLGKVRNYCSHAASPTHAAPSLSRVDDLVAPAHTAPS